MCSAIARPFCRLLADKQSRATSRSLAFAARLTSRLPHAHANERARARPRVRAIQFRWLALLILPLFFLALFRAHLALSRLRLSLIRVRTRARTTHARTHTRTHTRGGPKIEKRAARACFSPLLWDFFAVTRYVSAHASRFAKRDSCHSHVNTRRRGRVWIFLSWAMIYLRPPKTKDRTLRTMLTEIVRARNQSHNDDARRAKRENWFVKRLRKITPSFRAGRNETVCSIPEIIKSCLDREVTVVYDVRLARITWRYQCVRV